MVVLTNMNHKPDNCWECGLKDENGDCFLIKDSRYLYYFEEQYEQCPIEEIEERDLVELIKNKKE